jgi:hypothetical protein
MKLSGRLTFVDMGAGAWVLEAEDGKRYELQGVDGRALGEGARLEVEGEVDEGRVSTAMAGRGFRVKRWTAR